MCQQRLSDEQADYRAPMVAPTRNTAAMLLEALSKRQLRFGNQCMCAYAHDERSDTAFFTRLGGLKKEIYTSLRPIAKAIEDAEGSCSAKALLEPIKQYVEAC